LIVSVVMGYVMGVLGGGAARDGRTLGVVSEC
jgi:hypothetical protein